MILLAVVYFASAYVGVPLSLFMGWRKCKSVIAEKTFVAWLALTSLTIATLSTALAVGSLLHGGWAYYDPTLMKIYRYGILLSLVAFVLGLAAIWKRTPIRWFAPIASFGMLMFWLGAAISE